MELELVEEFYYLDYVWDGEIVQEIFDGIGIYVVLIDNGFCLFVLIEVLSWCFMVDGIVYVMLVDEEKVKFILVLFGDESFYLAQEQVEFKYFFQYCIVNKIKE